MTRAEVGQLRWHARSGCWQRWSGRRWSEALYSRDPASLQDPRDLRDAPGLDEDRRSRLLAQARDEQVLHGGSVVDARPLSVTMSWPEPVDHLAHLVGALLTGGLWAIAWAARVHRPRERRARLEVDEWGHVWSVEPD